MGPFLARGANLPVAMRGRSGGICRHACSDVLYERLQLLSRRRNAGTKQGFRERESSTGGAQAGERASARWNDPPPMPGSSHRHLRMAPGWSGAMPDAGPHFGGLAGDSWQPPSRNPHREKAGRLHCPARAARHGCHNAEPERSGVPCAACRRCVRGALAASRTRHSPGC